MENTIEFNNVKNMVLEVSSKFQQLFEALETLKDKDEKLYSYCKTTAESCYEKFFQITGAEDLENITNELRALTNYITEYHK